MLTSVCCGNFNVLSFNTSYVQIINFKIIIITYLGSADLNPTYHTLNTKYITHFEF